MLNHSFWKLHRNWVVLLLLIAAGCATPEEAEKEGERGPWYWPSPPDQPRFVYEVTLRYQEDFLPPSDSALTNALFSQSQTPSFEKPFGIAARNGKIYVTDTVGKRVVAYDVPRRKIFSFGVRLEGKLEKPLGIALDPEDNVYVADVSGRRVVVYDRFGLYVRSIGSKDDLIRPTGVAVSRDGNRVYVVDDGGVNTDNHRVMVYDKEGKQLSIIGKRGVEDGEFNLPIGIAVGPDDTIYVLDTGNFRVQAFDPQGNFLRKWGQASKELGNFARARAIAVDGQGNVYVSDSSFSNVQIFTSQGELLLSLGEPSPLQDGPGKLALPSGVAVDETGRLYIVDQYFSKVEVLRPLSDEEGKEILAQKNQRD